MKIRNGFVSNSSSSSFVVAFPKKPNTKKSLQRMLFGSEKFFANPYDWDHTCSGWPIEMVVNAIWEQLVNQTPNNKKAIFEGFQGWYDGYPNCKDFEDMEGKTNWIAWEDADAEMRHKKVDEFMRAHPLHYIYVFHFADENGRFECALEHGYTFNNVPHEVISRH